MEWTAQAWKAALTAMRERASAAEILALYEGGAISCMEMLSAAWEVCHNEPALRAELARQFRNCPNEHVAYMVGGGLEQLAAQRAEPAP